MTPNDLQNEIDDIRAAISELNKEIEDGDNCSNYAEGLLDWLQYIEYPECGLAIVDIVEGSPTEGDVVDDGEVKKRYIKYKMDYIADLERELAGYLSEK